MVWGVDEGLFAGITTGSDRRVMRETGCLGAAGGLRSKGAGLLGWGWGLLLCAFTGERYQQYYYIGVS